MTQTLSVSLSDAVIRRHLNDPTVRQLRDPRYPLRLRFNAARTRASWHVIKYAEGGTRWRRAGTWPELTTKALLSRLPEIQAELAVNPQSGRVRVTTMELTGDVLCWYRDRVARDASLSKTRKSTIKSAINRHVLPLLGEVPFATLNHATVDERLVWPLQERLALSTVRQVLAILKQSFAQAHRLLMIDANPVAALRFADFISAAITPKPGSLRAEMLPDLLESVARTDNPFRVLLCLMLMHGTRLGETRLSRWDHFDLSGGWWTIPAENTKPKRAHRLPLTAHALELLTIYRNWQGERGYTGVYLFPVNGRPLSSAEACRGVKSISAGRWSSHDIRKLARTSWADLGVDYMVGELLLNHALTKLDRTYIHTYVERQAADALSTYHDWLLAYGLKFALAETTPRQPRNRRAQRRR